MSQNVRPYVDPLKVITELVSARTGIPEEELTRDTPVSQGLYDTIKFDLLGRLLGKKLVVAETKSLTIGKLAEAIKS
jgi:hypothetical protein